MMTCAVLRVTEQNETLLIVIKIAFIGAGSIEFTRNVATDLCGFAELSGRLHLSLHDISAERLAFAERLVNRIVEQTGAVVTVTASLDRAVAIEGAKYVINEVQVGGYDATRLDFDIPAKFGLRQTIGDTIGIGGIFRGLRTIPVAVALATDMLRALPGRVPAQLHQPDGDAAVGDLLGHRVHAGLRAVPLRAGHARVPGRPGGSS